MIKKILSFIKKLILKMCEQQILHIETITNKRLPQKKYLILDKSGVVETSFDTISECAQFLGVTKRSVSNYLNNKSKNKEGFVVKDRF